MKIEKVTTAFVVIIAIGVLAAIGIVLYRLDVDEIYTLALIGIGGVVLALIVAAAAFPIKAHRSGGPRERERIIERDRHTIEHDGRVPEAPKIHLLDRQQGMHGAFPDLLRAAYLAGVRGLTHEQEQETVDGEVRDLTDEWRGEIRE